MDDPSKFANITEYYLCISLLAILIISELTIWFFTVRGNRDKSTADRSDRGTMWLIVIGWCCSIVVGAYFRSQYMPEIIRTLLFPHFVFYVGILLIIGGIVIRCMTILSLKDAFTLSVKTTEDQHLIQTGLYGIVRNPAYTGSILSLIGVSLAYRHILGMVSVIIICMVCYGIRIKVEEKALSARFGNEFEEYSEHTKYKLFPGIY